MAFFIQDNDFDSFFNDPVFRRRKIQRSDSEGIDGKGFQPKLDLFEDKNANSVTATFELPGMKKEDITIDVHQEHLTISGEVKSASESEVEGINGAYTVRERKFGKFTRSVKLPKGTKAEDVRAKFENGVLSVTFPATQPENAPARITIN